MNYLDDAVEYLEVVWFFIRTFFLALLSPLWIVPYLIYKRSRPTTRAAAGYPRCPKCQEKSYQWKCANCGHEETPRN